MDRDSTKGGERMGSVAMVLKKPLAGTLTRVTDLAVPGRLQDGDEIGQREGTGLIRKAVDQRFGQRIDDEQQQKRKGEKNGDQQQGLTQNHLRLIEALCAGSGICHERSS